MADLQNFCFDPFDEDTFRQLPEEEAAAIMKDPETIKKILDGHKRRIYELTFHNPRLPQLPLTLRQREFCPESSTWNSILESRRKNADSCSPAIFSTVFCEQRYPQTSIHSLMFGAHRPVILRGKYLYLLDEISGMTNSFYNTLLTELQMNALRVTNPAAVIQRRIAEIASSVGCHPTTLSYDILPKVSNKSRVQEFWKEPLPWIRPEQSYKNRDPDSVVRYWNSIEIVFMLVFFTSLYSGYPADFFVLQDFSEYVTYKNFQLTQKQRDLLSAFLLATPEAQDAAMAKIAVANMRKAHITS